MCKPPEWKDREEYIFTIEKVTSALRIIADACGNGGYTETASVEEALNLLADNISEATQQLRLALWPGEETDTEGRSPAYLEYRRLYQAWIEAIDAESGAVCDADGAVRDAVDAILARPIRSMNDLAELGIVAHDFAWDRHAQNYRVREGCTEDILRALLLGVLELGGIKKTLHQPPAGWKSPLTISN